MRRRLLILLAMVAVAGCSAPAAGPEEAGVCWRRTYEAGAPKLIVLSRGDDNLETCAMHLEVARLMHHRATISGDYQGQLLFIDDRRILAAQSLSSGRYNVFTAVQRKDLDAKIADLLGPGK